MAALKRIQPALAYAASHLDEDVSLVALARQTGLSVYHLQRAFSTVAGETPKQFTLRLRLGRAAAMLLTRADSVLDIALNCGFQSHEVFSRAFRRRFGIARAPIADAALRPRPSPRTTRKSSIKSAPASGSITSANQQGAQ